MKHLETVFLKSGNIMIHFTNNQGRFNCQIFGSIQEAHAFYSELI